MRKSIQRDLILNIINNSKEHLTVDEVYLLAKKDIPNISLGTVYRNINQLFQNKMIRKIELDSKIIRCDNFNKPHSHLICNKCGAIEDVFELNLIRPDLLEKFKVTDYDLVLKGICSKCLKKED